MENEEFSWESKGSLGSWDRLGENSKGELIINDQYTPSNTFFDINKTIEANERRYIMRFMVIIIDWSSSTLLNGAGGGSQHFSLEKSLIPFLKDFFLQNPLGQIAIYSMKDSLCTPIITLSPSSSILEEGRHITSLLEFQKNIEPSGLFSLENVLITTRILLTNLPNWASRELLILSSTLTITDPSPDWFLLEKAESLINLIKEEDICINIINLRGSLNIFKKITILTGGSEFYCDSSLPSFLTPPKIPQKGPNFASLIPMLFPKRNQYGYSCPRCLTLTDSLPSQCIVCGSTLADATHIARSFHFLFPPPPIIKCHSSILSKCSMCGVKSLLVGNCKKCLSLFCEDCEEYERKIHQCPNCL